MPWFSLCSLLGALRRWNNQPWRVLAKTHSRFSEKFSKLVSHRPSTVILLACWKRRHIALVIGHIALVIEISAGCNGFSINTHQDDVIALTSSTVILRWCSYLFLASFLLYKLNWECNSRKYIFIRFAKMAPYTLNDVITCRDTSLDPCWRGFGMLKC